MTHEWNDYYDAGLGPQLPLTSGQQVQLVSGILPSGESNFFDLEQVRQDGSGINRDYDYDKEAAGSGVVATFPPDTAFNINLETGKPSGIIDEERESGIFHQNLIGHFAAESGSIFSSGYYVPSGFDVRFQKYIRPSVKQAEPPRPDNAYRVMDSYIHHKSWPDVDQPFVQISFLSDYEVVVNTAFNRYANYTPNKNGYYDAGYKNI